ncbi:MAG: hypothetical protein ABIO70_02515 [Pseudomonadota bacterium]
MDGEETWEASAIHVLTCDVTVTGALTIAPGGEVYADRGTRLAIDHGSLVAQGSGEDPILLASHEGFPLAGDWVGLVGDEADVQLASVTLRHAGSEGALISLAGGSASLESVILSNGISQGLYATGTAFSAIHDIEVAYVPAPLVLPWTAAQVLGEIFFQEVGDEVIALSEDTLTQPATLIAQDYPYRSQGLTISGGGQLTVSGGATLELSGDIEVEDGGLAVYGDTIQRAVLSAGETDGGFTVHLGAAATAATFRYAIVSGGSVVSDAPALFFTDTEVSALDQPALTVHGGVKDDDSGNLDDNTLSGAAPGLVVDLDLLPLVGENDCSGSAFDGVAVAGGAVSEGLVIASWPSDPVLVSADLSLTGGAVDLTDGRLSFADGVGLTVDGAHFTATGTTFQHEGGATGGWAGITVAAGSDDALFDGATVTQGGADGGANLTLAADATVRDSLVSYSAGWGILVVGDANPTLEANTYQNNALGDVGP